MRARRVILCGASPLKSPPRISIDLSDDMPIPAPRPKASFTDEMGVVWTARTVLRRHVVLGIDRGERSVSHDTWLVFESRAGRKRLTAFPKNWETLSPGELMILAEKAVPWRPK